MNDFLKSLSKEQLVKLQSILKNEVDGDIDFLIFKVEEELYNRNLEK